MQAEEQEKLIIKEKSKLFVQLIKGRKKHFAAMRAQEIRNKPPTKVQKRNTMSNYLKNMAGYKHNQLKNKSFDDIQKLFDKAMKRVNTFVDMDTELVEGFFSHMLKRFDKEDLETLWKLVKAKHGLTRPKEGYERVLWGDLKTMFDPHVEDQVWRNQQDYRVLDWKLYDSCGVHSLMKQSVHIHMLVEKRYPFTPATITDMLNKNLQCDHFSKMGRIVRIKRLLDDLEVTTAKGNVGSQRKCNHSISNEMVRKHDERGSTTLGRSKVLENKHHLDKLKTNAYFPSLSPCFKPAQPLTKNTHEPLDPNDYDLCAPNSHHEDEEVSFDEDVDEWLNAKMGKRMTGQDKEEEEDALIDILKTVLPPKEMNPGSFPLPCIIGNLKLYAMVDLGASINVMPKSLFEHLKLADLKETSMVVEMADMTKKAPLGIVENILVKIDKFLFHSDFVVIDMLEGPNETMLLGKPFIATIHAQIDVFRREILLGISEEKESEYFNPLEIETDVFSYDSPVCLLFEQSTHPCSDVWICQILQEISQKRTRERMSDQEAKEIKAEAREIMPQPSTVNCS
ncbi:copia protein [Tanacetum coccineum]